MLRTTALLILISGSAVMAQDADEVSFVKGLLAELQPPSFAENVEFCGIIGFDADGDLVASPISRGDESSCLVEDDGTVEVAVASFHTHAAFAPDYSSEFPSVDDVEGDEAEGIDGYVATPGGRFWYIDTAEDITISQICGVGCLPSDPNFVPGVDGKIEQSYTYDELVTFFEN